MNLFITKISRKVEIMDKKQIMGAAKYLLEFPNKKDQAMKEEDPFPFHKKFWNSKDFEDNLSNDIKTMISCRRDKLLESDLLQLLSISSKSSPHHSSSKSIILFSPIDMFAPPKGKPTK